MRHALRVPPAPVRDPRRRARGRRRHRRGRDPLHALPEDGPVGADRAAPAARRAAQLAARSPTRSCTGSSASSTSRTSGSRSRWNAGPGGQVPLRVFAPEGETRGRLDLVKVGDVRAVVVVGRRPGGEPGVEDLGQHGSDVVRSDSASTLASFQLRAPAAVSASPHSAARMPATLFAAIDAPVPVQQQTTAWSARPSATSRAAASDAHAQSSRSPSASAPCRSGSWPRSRSCATTAPATPVSSSAATLIRIAANASRRLSVTVVLSPVGASGCPRGP